MALFGKILYRLLLCVAWVLLLVMVAIIWATQPDVKDLGNGYIYDAERKDICGKVDFPPKVIEFYYDDRFIVAIQKWTGGNINSLYDLGTDHSAVYKKLKEGQDSIFFWIIDKKYDIISGPDTQEEFIKVSSDKKVVKELITKALYSCKELKGSQRRNQ